MLGKLNIARRSLTKQRPPVKPTLESQGTGQSLRWGLEGLECHCCCHASHQCGGACCQAAGRRRRQN
eukprot:14379481-Alexandrium_andersonii.AAC.1